MSTACEPGGIILTLDVDTIAKGVWSKFNINFCGMLCWNTKLVISFFQENKCELFIKCKVHFTFCSDPSTLSLFDGLQGFGRQFGYQFDRAPSF